MTPPRPPRTRLVAALVALVAGVVGLLAPAGPARADDHLYVALGDSYSSGLGTGEYLPDGSTCQRSPHAFPALLAAEQGWRLRFGACAGATVPHVRRAQLGLLGRRTARVTVSVGGNDAGFARVLSECATPWWLGDCRGAVEQARAFVQDRLPERLRRLLRDVEASAPDARVVVVGYPRLFQGEDCNAGTFFTPGEQRRLNRTADLLDRVLGRAAEAHGARFADPTQRFLGHGVCAEREWVNGLSRPITESYHPNRAGHRHGYAPVVRRRLGVTAVEEPPGGDRGLLAAPPAVTTPVPSPAHDDLRRREGVRAPDLTGPRAARAARAHGVDLERWLRRRGLAAPPEPAHRAGHRRVAGCW